MIWDLFCTVIDNYGDIGVTWRLARQLAGEHGIPVRLWVDDLAAFRRIRPEIDPAADCQRLAGVEVRRWVSPLPAVAPGAVVIEALACQLPEEFVARMAARDPRPVWLNLEYLSAEDWVAGVHGLPSPHPRLPLTKHFFMPGYTERTGGLTRERGLAQARAAFQSEPKTRAAFWRGLGLPPEREGEWRISLFSYENRACAGLLAAWAAGPRPVRALVPVGRVLPEIAAWFGVALPVPGVVLERGGLSLHVLPMLDQDGYDRLLWGCDLNFVRGEDSCVRAQLAARPMVWQAYRQDEAAHLAKLDAFLNLYHAGLAPGPAAAEARLWRAWNREADLTDLWPALMAAYPALAAHARDWAGYLERQSDLATNLVNFCGKSLK